MHIQTHTGKADIAVIFNMQDLKNFSHHPYSYELFFPCSVWLLWKWRVHPKREFQNQQKKISSVSLKPSPNSNKTGNYVIEEVDTRIRLQKVSQCLSKTPEKLITFMKREMKSPDTEQLIVINLDHRNIRTTCIRLQSGHLQIPQYWIRMFTNQQFYPMHLAFCYFGITWVKLKPNLQKKRQPLQNWLRMLVRL